MESLKELKSYIKKLNDIIPEIAEIENGRYGKEKYPYRKAGEDLLQICKKIKKIRPSLDKIQTKGISAPDMNLTKDRLKYDVSTLLTSLQLCGSYCKYDKSPNPKHVKSHLDTVIPQMDLVGRELYDF